jgi:hypothetical protein
MSEGVGKRVRMDALAEVADATVLWRPGPAASPAAVETLALSKRPRALGQTSAADAAICSPGTAKDHLEPTAVPCLAGASAKELLALERTVLEADCACARRTQGCVLACAAEGAGATLARALKETKVMPGLRETSVPHLPLALFLHAGGGVGNGFVTGRKPPYSLDAACILKIPARLGLAPMPTMHSGFNTNFSHPLTGVVCTTTKDKRFVDPMLLRVLARVSGALPSRPLSWTARYSDLLEIDTPPADAAAEHSPQAGRPFVALCDLGREHLPRWLALQMVGDEAAPLSAMFSARLLTSSSRPRCGLNCARRSPLPP